MKHKFKLLLLLKDHLGTFKKLLDAIVWEDNSICGWDTREEWAKTLAGAWEEMNGEKTCVWRVGWWGVRKVSEVEAERSNEVMSPLTSWLKHGEGRGREQDEEETTRGERGRDPDDWDQMRRVKMPKIPTKQEKNINGGRHTGLGHLSRGGGPSKAQRDGGGKSDHSDQQTPPSSRTSHQKQSLRYTWTYWGYLGILGVSWCSWGVFGYTGGIWIYLGGIWWCRGYLGIPGVTWVYLWGICV